MDTTDINDILSKEGKQFKSEPNQYMDLKGNLNTNDNPFIKASNNQNAKKQKNKISNSQSKYKYNKKPPTKFDTKNSKELDINYIEVMEEDKDGDLKKNNFWYKKFKYLNKKYNMSSKYKSALNKEYVIYYCHYHWTYIESEKYNEKGKKLRSSKCYSRVYYYKNLHKYLMDWGHSEFCDKLNIPKYENYADIEGEISNYKEFKNDIIKYLNSHPIIKYTEYKKKEHKLYYKNHCNFRININTLKNIYYNWRKENIIFKKYSIFEFNKTKNGFEYLKDYSYTYIYNKSGKTHFLHEHAIFCSDFFIKKLRTSKHWYIDCTFIVPPNFKQMLVIMYRDEISGVRYPGLFAILNNKKKEGYMLIFKKIKDIITIENSKELSLISYSVDYEQSLLDTCRTIFKDI